MLYGQPAPEASPRRAPSWAPGGAQQRGRLGAGWGTDLQTHHRGDPRGGPPGCLRHSADTTTPPKAAETSGGCWAGPSSAHLCRTGQTGWVPGPPGTRLLEAEWGAPEKGGSVASSTRSAQEPHTQPGLDPGGQRTAPSSPWRLGGRPVPTQPQGHPRTPRGDRLGGSSHNAYPYSCSGDSGGAAGPRTPSSGPPADTPGSGV